MILFPGRMSKARLSPFPDLRFTPDGQSVLFARAEDEKSNRKKTPKSGEKIQRGVRFMFCDCSMGLWRDSTKQKKGRGLCVGARLVCDLRIMQRWCPLPDDARIALRLLLCSVASNSSVPSSIHRIIDPVPSHSQVPTIVVWSQST